MFTKTIIAAALVAATAATTVPASAQGQISFGFSAQNQQERDLLTLGVVAYQIANGGDAGEVLSNVANGGSVGLVHQEGNGHNGSLVQNGGGNAGALIQLGNGANGHLNQNGGQGDLVIQIGLE
jgi:minor curlin subunit